MKNIHGLIQGLVLFLFLFLAVANAEPDKSVPQAQVASNAGPKDQAEAVLYRNSILHTLEYWLAAGLPQPPRLDALTFISSYQDLRVLDLLKIHNPEISNIREHILAQWHHLLKSNFRGVLRKLEEKNQLPSGILTQQFFDTYARIRYGYSFPNFAEEIINNPLIADLYAELGDAMPSDNAYYRRYPKIDLTEHLPLDDSKPQVTLMFLSLISPTPDTMSIWEYTHHSKVGMSNQLVALPRITQTPDDPDLGTHDPSIPRHEYGHTINSSNVEIPRMVDEAFADFISASSLGDPRMGSKFASDSAIIAKRILQMGNNSPQAQAAAFSLNALAKKGSLRNLAETWTIDHLVRETRFADSYQAGNPIRTFLWRMKTRLGDQEKASLEKIFLKTTLILGSQPILIPYKTRILLNLRSLGLEISQKKQIALKVMELAGGKSADQKIVLQAIREIQKRSIQKEIAQMKERLDKWKARVFYTRPKIQADYILAETFRAFSLAAQEVLANDADKLKEFLVISKEEMTYVMNANVDYVESSSGKLYPIFFKASKNYKAVLQKIQQLLNSREGSTLTLQQPNLTQQTAEEAMRFLNNIVGAIQEFERTGNEIFLTDPWPKFDRSLEQLKTLMAKYEGGASPSDDHSHASPDRAYSVYSRDSYFTAAMLALPNLGAAEKTLFEEHPWDCKEALKIEGT